MKHNYLKLTWKLYLLIVAPNHGRRGFRGVLDEAREVDRAALVDKKGWPSYDISDWLYKQVKKSTSSLEEFISSFGVRGSMELKKGVFLDQKMNP